MFCSKCGAKNEKIARFCGSCGQIMVGESHSSRKGWLIAGILISLLLLSGIGYGFLTISNPEVASRKTVITEIPVAQLEKKPVQLESKPTNVKSATHEKDKTLVIKETMPKVFTIFTEEGLGSGFLYKKGGLIVTNAHVVAGFTDVIVRNSSGQDSLGKVIGISDRYDVALIRAADYLKVEPLMSEGKESSIGTEVIALGSPQGFENSASIGYLTGLNRDMELGFVYEKVYQIDAQIDQGSSGGPLVDAKTGRVIGINSLIYTKNNLFGFSIPMYSVIGLLDSWGDNPMNAKEVASVFGVYDDYTYEDSTSAENDTYDEEFVYDDNYEFSFDEESLSNFIVTFREYYETALQYEEFYWIEDLLLPDSPAYNEFDEYIQDIAEEGMTFNFINNTITDIEIYTDYAIVHTFEEFDFNNAAEDFTNYERYKEYHIVMDENGYYQITDVFISD